MLSPRAAGRYIFQSCCLAEYQAHCQFLPFVRGGWVLPAITGRIHNRRIHTAARSRYNR